MTAVSPPRPRVSRWAGRVLVGLLLAWLVVSTVYQVVTGNFWLWGIPNPLAPLIYFAGPPLALAGVALLLLSRTGWPWPERTALSCAIALVALVALHMLLSGRTWVWVMPDLMPPLLFLLLPLGLLIALAWLRTRLRPVITWSTLVLTTVALVLGVGQSGLNLAALTGGVSDGPAPAGALRVVSWDTLHWDAGGADHFYRYLTEQRADLYLLQDYTPDTERLAREFPGYDIATAGDLLTISRFPIVARKPMRTNPTPPEGTENITFIQHWEYGALRTDLEVGGHTLSVYNLHFYDRFSLNVFPLTPEFLGNVKGLDEGRQAQLDAVLADTGRNANPVLVSGNLNMLPNMGELHRFDGFTDASRAGRSLYPSTMRFFGIDLWQVDWSFTSPEVGVHDYALRSPEGLSSHDLQDLVISIPR
jgi:endonuclease/exonuclease/phosphatase (EEP) superfamily protein YafD